MDVVTALVVQVEALSKKIDGLLVVKTPIRMMQCDLRGGGHGN